MAQTAHGQRRQQHGNKEVIYQFRLTLSTTSSKIRQAICSTTHKICTGTDKPIGVKSEDYFILKVLFSFLEKCVFSPWQCRASSTLFIWLNEKRSFLVPRKVRFLAMTMSEQARHCSFGLTKTFKKHALATSPNALFFVLLHKLNCVRLQEKQVFLFKLVVARHHIANAQQ